MSWSVPSRSRASASKLRSDTASARLLAPWLALSSFACLPQDTRPAPATVAASIALGPRSAAAQVDTADGYSLRVERTLVAAGRLELGGDGCNRYGSSVPYLRILPDLSAVPEPLGVRYGLGDCTLVAQAAPPPPWAVLAPGANADDLRELRSTEGRQLGPGSAVADAGSGGGSRSGRSDDQGASLIVEGRATPVEANGEALRFRFELGIPVSARRCAPEGRDAFVLASGDRIEPVLELEPLVMLGGCDRDGEGDPPLLFAPLALADARGDADGLVTLAETAAVGLDEVPALAECRSTQINTLLHLLSFRLARQGLSLVGGHCARPPWPGESPPDEP
jgi:hypothetical protein